MCWLGNLFKPKPLPLTIPHPEEAQNSQPVIDNISFYLVLERWFVEWGVPVEYQDFWRAWPIAIVPNLTYYGNYYPALTWVDRTEIDPTWANPGVLAHEMAHVSYSFLTITDIGQFDITYQEVKSDALVELLESQNQYMKTNTLELHAEVYRYLGQKMPDRLKPFYPKLF